jgi:hypothetical protein
MLTHIDWDEDALIIEEQGHKADQKGEFKYWKHIYANPMNPELSSSCLSYPLNVLWFST